MRGMAEPAVAIAAITPLTEQCHSPTPRQVPRWNRDGDSTDAGSGQEPGRLDHLEHGPPAVVRRGLTGRGRADRTIWPARPWPKLGAPHARRQHGRLQPDLLPRRVGVAPPHDYRARGLAP